mmetsp:Transcript_90/g.166  ORF Transcript_90/g.166 Transcript_90/m.166 type:complete len:92 (-) Transcript_90:117-392(-)
MLSQVKSGHEVFCAIVRRWRAKLRACQNGGLAAKLHLDLTLLPPGFNLGFGGLAATGHFVMMRITIKEKNQKLTPHKVGRLDRFGQPCAAS